MGVNIKDLISRKEIEIKFLKDKVLAVDTMNMLYQFITTIRQADGSPLTDSKGNITSHLNGLFFRTVNLMSQGIKLVYIFDGKAPELKRKEQQRRSQIKEDALKAYEEAKSKEDIELMKKYASRTARLTSEMINEAKELLECLGIPIVQAPCEGDAQAAYLVKKGDAYAAVSQDYDTLLHGTPKLIRNLSILGKKKKAGKLAFETYKPELIELSENLNQLGIDRNQMIALAMLIGTDYNIGGVKGIGPKNAIKLVKEHGNDFDALFKEVKWDEHFDIEWSEVYYTIQKMQVTDEYVLSWKPFNREKLIDLLVDKHNFNEQRVNDSLDKLEKLKEQQQQKGLSEFF